MTRADLRRIHAVTRHYGTLRGGVTRAVWLMVTLGVTHGLYFLPSRRGSFSVVLPLLMIFGGAGLGVLSLIGVRQWMDRRFGRVRSGGELMKGAVTVAALWAFMAGNYLDEHYLSGSNAPSMVFLGSAAFGVWLMVSVGRYGAHNLLPTAISLIAAMTLITVDGQASFDAWQWNALRVTALAWLTAGVIDFMLLWRTLGRQGQRGVADAA